MIPNYAVYVVSLIKTACLPASCRPFSDQRFDGAYSARRQLYSQQPYIFLDTLSQEFAGVNTRFARFFRPAQSKRRRAKAARGYSVAVCA